jgi:hypothetical protein
VRAAIDSVQRSVDRMPEGPLKDRYEKDLKKYRTQMDDADPLTVLNQKKEGLNQLLEDIQTEIKRDLDRTEDQAKLEREQEEDQEKLDRERQKEQIDNLQSAYEESLDTYKLYNDLYEQAYRDRLQSTAHGGASEEEINYRRMRNEALEQANRYRARLNEARGTQPADTQPRRDAD